MSLASMCQCNSKQMRDFCADLILEAFQKIQFCPIITLPNLIVDYHKRDANTELFLETFKRGSHIVWIDINRYVPHKLEKTMNYINEAEQILNEVHINEVIKENDNKVEYPAMKDNNIIKEFSFINKITLVLKFHGKKLLTGRFIKNCPVILEKGKLMCLTLDDRYRYCSTNEIIFITNLCEFDKELDCENCYGKLVYIGENCKLKILKRIEKHFTCCVKIGGKINSYDDAFIEGCDPNTIPCLNDIDKENCQQVLVHKATAIVIPHPHTSCYVQILRKYINNKIIDEDKNYRINILVEFDEEKFLNMAVCEQKVTLESMEIANGVFLPKPLEKCHKLIPFIKDKIVISQYLPKIPSEMYHGVNGLLPTCFLLTHNSNQEKFTKQFTTFASMINSIHRSVMGECCHAHYDESQPKAFLSISNSGIETLQLALTRHPHPIICVTDRITTVKELQLYKGVKPIYYDWKTELKCKSDKIVEKYLLRLCVAYVRHLCLLFDKFCIKEYEIIQKIDYETESCASDEETESSLISDLDSICNCIASDDFS